MSFTNFGSQNNYNKFKNCYVKGILDISGTLILRSNTKLYGNDFNSFDDISGNLNFNNYAYIYFNDIMDIYIKNISLTNRLNQVLINQSNIENLKNGNNDGFSNKIIFQDEIAVNNNIIDGGSIGIGKSALIGLNLTVANNIYCSNKITTNDIKINDNIYYKFQMCGMLISSTNFNIPLMNSIKNTTLTYTNLNLQSILSTNGNSCSIFLYPKYKIIFYNYYTILFQLDNTSGENILYSLINFDYELLCTNIIIKNNNNLNI